jgi:hypothetical protein
VSGVIHRDCPVAGTYRLRHFGDYKHIFGGTHAFNGTSGSFRVATPQPPHTRQHQGSRWAAWGQYVRDHVFFAPVVLFGGFLVASVACRQSQLGSSGSGGWLPLHGQAAAAGQ